MHHLGNASCVRQRDHLACLSKNERGAVWCEALVSQETGEVDRCKIGADHPRRLPFEAAAQREPWLTAGREDVEFALLDLFAVLCGIVPWPLSGIEFRGNGIAAPNHGAVFPEKNP